MLCQARSSLVASSDIARRVRGFLLFFLSGGLDRGYASGHCFDSESPKSDKWSRLTHYIRNAEQGMGSVDLVCMHVSSRVEMRGGCRWHLSMRKGSPVPRVVVHSTGHFGLDRGDLREKDVPRRMRTSKPDRARRRVKRATRTSGFEPPGRGRICLEKETTVFR